MVSFCHEKQWNPSRVFFSGCGLGGIGGEVVSLFSPLPPGVAKFEPLKSIFDFPSVSLSEEAIIRSYRWT